MESDQWDVPTRAVRGEPVLRPSRMEPSIELREMVNGIYGEVFATAGRHMKE